MISLGLNVLSCECECLERRDPCRCRNRDFILLIAFPFIILCEVTPFFTVVNVFICINKMYNIADYSGALLLVLLVILLLVVVVVVVVVVLLVDSFNIVLVPCLLACSIQYNTIQFSSMEGIVSYKMTWSGSCQILVLC